MNTLFKKLVSAVLAAALVASVAYVSPVQASADSAAKEVEVIGEVAVTPETVSNPDNATPYFAYTHYVTTYNKYDRYTKYYTLVPIYGVSGSAKITNIKSSNSAIKASKSSNSIRLDFGDKSCKSTVSCTVNGTKLSFVISVVPYANPLKSMKFGGSDLASSFKTANTAKTSFTATKKTLTLKTNSNWCIYQISIWNNSKNIKRINYSNVTSATINNVTFKKNYGIFIYAVNKKTGVKECLYIYNR